MGQELRADELLNLQRGIINYCEKLKCNFVKWYFILIQKNESIFLIGGKKCFFTPWKFLFSVGQDMDQVEFQISKKQKM